MIEHHRRSIRIPGYDYAAPGAYFMTLVTQDRACLFGRVEGGGMELSAKGSIADECWRAIPEHFPNVALGAYVVMPNHIHGILILHDRTATMSSSVGATHWVAPTAHASRGVRPHGPRPGSIGAIVGAYKMAVTRLIVRNFGGVPCIWQRNYYEHIIRDDADWSRVHAYIACNIANWATDEESGEA